MTQPSIKIEGLDDIEAILGELLPKEARNLNRATIHAVASQVAKDARKKAPRDKGELRKAIKAKRRRPRLPDAPYSDVYVTHGKNAKHDAFYWRFVEYGTVGQPARPFIKPAADAVRRDIKQVYRDKFFLKLRARLKRNYRARL